MIRELDQDRLERSFTYLVEHYPAASPGPSGFNSLAGSKHRNNSLVNALAEFLEGSEDFCAERVAEIDGDLERRNAYTLSFLREYFGRARQEE